MVFLENALKKGLLANAYCFVGPDGVGKRTVARYLAAKILSIDGEKISTHPDFYYLEREIDEKKNRLKKDISVEQARRLRAFLQNRPWLGGWRAAIIDEAELLNEEAANALLKTLEEAGEGILIFLLTTNDRALPQTVRSRCQTIIFSPVSEKEIVVGLKEAGHDASEAEAAAAISWGRPGRAIAMLADPELRLAYERETGRWQRLLNRPFHEKLKEIDDLFDDKERERDPIRERDRLAKTLDVWGMLWRDTLLKKISDQADETTRLSAAAIGELIDDISVGRILLGQNIHPRLLMEKILLKF